jgi:release factor glutamine methyltransferase
MQKFVEHIKNELYNIYSKEEITSIISLIFNKLAGINSIEFLLLEENKLSEKITQKIETAVERLKLNEPVQYVLGQTEFYGLPFLTDSRALIPRPETEELVEWILQTCPNAQKILDIGTGSGCIAVTLAQKIKKSRVFAFDISLDALNLAHENADLNYVFVHFFHCNILKMNDFDEKFDVIVSNPPYVMLSEKQFMKPNVLDFEPPTALFVPDNNALLFYEHIINFAKKQLYLNGTLFFEINQNFGKEIVKLLKINNFKKIELKKDISGKNRMIRAEISTNI